MNFLETSLTSTGPVVLFILYTLSALALFTCFLVGYKIFVFFRSDQANHAVQRHISSEGRLDLEKSTFSLHRHGPFHRLYVIAQQSRQRAGPLASANRLKDILVRNLIQAVKSEVMLLERGLPLLATIGSTAPFIGLFGTVWGIMGAMQHIGLRGNAGLNVVAGPVSEALLATAAGLAAAIPAVIAYNLLLRRLRVMHAQMENFATDLINAGILLTPDEPVAKPGDKKHDG